jgi:hypothetical protein
MPPRPCSAYPRVTSTRSGEAGSRPSGGGDDALRCPPGKRRGCRSGPHVDGRWDCRLSGSRLETIVRLRRARMPPPHLGQPDLPGLRRDRSRSTRTRSPSATKCTPDPFDMGDHDLAGEPEDGRLVGWAVADGERATPIGKAIENPSQPGRRGALRPRAGAPGRPRVAPRARRCRPHGRRRASGPPRLSAAPARRSRRRGPARTARRRSTRASAWPAAPRWRRTRRTDRSAAGRSQAPRGPPRR